MKLPNYRIGDRVRVNPQITLFREPFVGTVESIVSEDFKTYFYTVSGSVFLWREIELKKDHLECGKTFKQLMEYIGANYEQL